MLVRSLTMESRQRLAYDVLFDIFATYAGLVHAFPDTDWRAQNDCTYGRVFATFKLQFLTTGT